MRIKENSRKHFWGTHKGHDIQIDKEPDGRFYIIVTAPCGMHAYDGWAPDSIRTIKDAKHEALRGSCLT
jgi:hypothetical protein